MQEPSSSVLSETDYAYLAGLIDGDGHFALKAPSKSHLQIQVSMRHKPTIEYLRSTYGGATYTTTTQGKPFYRWTANRRLTEQLLPRIIPYLVTKRADAVNMKERLAA